MARCGILSHQTQALEGQVRRTLFVCQMEKHTTFHTIIENPIDAARLFLTGEILKKILKSTNEEGERVRQEKQNRANNGVITYKPISKDELECYLGVLIKCGALSLNNLDIHLLWSVQHGPAFVRAAMGRDRFKEIHSLLRFDDKNTRQARRQQSLLAPVLEISEDFEKLLRRYYTPGPFIAVDEQLVAFRGRCAFRMYMPKKPDRYGLKIFMAVDCKTLYPLAILPYLGQQTSTLAGTNGLGFFAVTKTCERFLNSGRNITTDRWFTSLPLAEHLRSNKTTLVGTVNTNKRCLPKQFLDIKGRNVQSSVFLFQRNTTLVSYVPKPNKSVVLLSTQHHSKDVVVEASNKPEIIMFYNQTKGAVDSVDFMVKKYTCRRKTKRWPLVYFLNLVDLGLLAAYILFMMKNPQQRNAAKRGDRKKFLISVGESLMKSHVRTRYETAVPSVKRTIRRSSLMEDSQEASSGPSSGAAEDQEPQTVKKRRCGKCPRSMDRKFKTVCKVCKQCLCPAHTVVTCSNCFARREDH